MYSTGWSFAGFGRWMHPSFLVSWWWEISSLPRPAPSCWPQTACFPWQDYSISRQALPAGISLNFFFVHVNLLLLFVPPLPLSPVFLIFSLPIFTSCLTSTFLLSWTTSFELILQLSCPPHTLWICPLSRCDVAIAGTGEAMPHSSAALVGCGFAPSLPRCDLSPGPLVGE